MSRRRLGGRGQIMRPAAAFAEANGFSLAFTNKNHLVFYGHGGSVHAPGTPHSASAATYAIQKMRKLIRANLHVER